MKKIKWWLETGIAGEIREDEFCVKDDVSEEEIEEMAKQEVFNCISWGYEVEKCNKDCEVE